jgi:hypothetical protein
MVVGALGPTVVTTIFPQFVSKVNVRANFLGSFCAGATSFGSCPVALVGAHLIAATFTAFAALVFGSATAEGDRSTEIAIAAIIVRFINIPCLM